MPERPAVVAGIFLVTLSIPLLGDGHSCVFVVNVPLDKIMKLRKLFAGSIYMSPLHVKTKEKIFFPWLTKVIVSNQLQRAVVWMDLNSQPKVLSETDLWRSWHLLPQLMSCPCGFCGLVGTVPVWGECLHSEVSLPEALLVSTAFAYKDWISHAWDSQELIEGYGFQLYHASLSFSSWRFRWDRNLLNFYTECGGDVLLGANVQRMPGLVWSLKNWLWASSCFA